jgi:hypothetical protein
VLAFCVVFIFLLLVDAAGFLERVHHHHQHHLLCSHRMPTKYALNPEFRAKKYLLLTEYSFNP